MNSELVSVENNFGLHCACAYNTDFSKEIANEILSFEESGLVECYTVSIFLFLFVTFILCFDDFTCFCNFCITLIYCLQQLFSGAASFMC